MNTASFRRELAVTDEYDVLVVGGGSAGCMAAIQAGRSGARTALIEKNGILGGTTVVSAVNFPGLFHAWGKQVIKGIGWEVLEETARRGGAVMPDFDTPYENHRHWEHQVLVNKFVYSAILDEFCVKAGVTLRFHEMPAAAYMENDRVHLVVAGKSGLSILRTKTVIDATGDANIAGMMGYERERGEHLQPGTLIYEIGGYQLEAIDKERLAELYQSELAAGRILPTDHLPGELPLWRELRSGGGNCMHITNIDGADSVSRSDAELKGRASLMRIYELLRKVPGCEGVQVKFAASECGIRETWRIVGEQRITLSEYTSGYDWPDAVCYSFYPIDIHRHGDNTIDIRPLRPGVFPTIPLGALIPRGSDRLLVAGRCISGDTEASSAYRVQATCMATGQAAGAAAALAASGGISVQQVSLDDTLALLKSQGAIVPGSLN